MIITLVVFAALLAATMTVCTMICSVNVFSLNTEIADDILDIRLPRVAIAAAVGAALACCGAVFQGLLRNPLADPFILGVSGGGAAGAVAAIALGIDFAFFGFSGLTVSAFAGALAALLLLLAFARGRSGTSTHTLILTGVVLNAIFSAIILFAMSMMNNQNVSEAYRWMMGSLKQAIDHDSPQIVAGCVVVAICCAALLAFARNLNLLALGEETAAQMGAGVERTKLALLILCALLTAVAVSLAGPIGFVGLIVPHILRIIVGPDHRILIPSAFFGGAIFLVVADTLARSLFYTELPVGVITALCGGPFLLWLLKSRARQASF